MALMSIELLDKSDKVLQATQEQILRALIILGDTAEGYAKLNCPTDTGRLRNSIAHVVDVGGKCTYIGTNVHYAPYVEFGTGSRAESNMGGNQSIGGQAPQPYLRPALSEHVDEYKKIVKTELST